MFLYQNQTDKINNIISNNKNVSFIQFLEIEIQKFLHSKKRNNMFVAREYYKGNHDILKRKRTVIGQNGEVEEIHNLPNNKIVDNQYSRVVDQKNNYLLSKPVTFFSDSEDLIQNVRKILNKKFFRSIKNLGEDSLNYGLSYLYIFINEFGKLDFKQFKAYEILPFWEDEEHINLSMLCRIYDIEQCNKNFNEIITQVEVYTKFGIHFFILKNNTLIPDLDKGFKPYMINSKNQTFFWNKIPIISFKANSKETPLINKIKTLQDALNTLRADFMNNMQEDARNTILVLKNYDGTNLSEFRKNLSEYGVVKVSTIDGNEGDVSVLKVNVDSNNYQILIEMLKKAIIENARAFDCKDERMSNNPNQMNIKSMYADIDLDANSMEMEFQFSFEQLFYFIKAYLKFTKNLDFFEQNIDVIFNKDVLINETEAINNCVNSINILSQSTIVSKHPWVTDAHKELKKINNTFIKNN